MGRLWLRAGSLALKQSEHATIAKALALHRTTLAREQSGRYYRRNGVLVAIGALLTLVALVAGVVALGPAAREAEVLFWLAQGRSNPAIRRSLPVFRQPHRPHS